MTKRLWQWCDACDGTGRELKHCPQFDDPYLMVPTRELCKKCGGTKRIDVEEDDDADE